MTSSPGWPLQPFDALADRRVRATVERLFGSTAGLDGSIHPDDEMFGYAVAAHRGAREAAAAFYFTQGWQIADAVRRAAEAHFGGIERVPSFLDFAAGFGRGTRFLVRAVGPERVWVSEIDAAALAFQRHSFGVGSVESAHRPERFTPDRRWALILAASFFSHLPADTFAAWAARLVGCLEPGGLLLLSVHGPRGAGVEVGRDGIHFLPESETRRLDGHEYGTSHVGEAFVRRALDEASGGRGSVRSFPRGLCGHQDLYVLALPAARGREADASRDLEVTIFPRGAVEDVAACPDGTLVVEGGLEPESDARQGPAPVGRIDLLRNGEPIADCAAAPRWRLMARGAEIEPDDLLVVRATAAGGGASILGAGTLATHPPRRAEGGGMGGDGAAGS